MGRFSFFLALALAFASARPAWCLDLIPLIGVGFANPSITGENPAPTSTSTNAVLGGGLLFYFPLTDSIGFDAGMEYIPREITENYAGVGPIETDFYLYQIPIIFRYAPIPYISLGVGGYFAYGVGLINNDNPAPVSYTVNTRGQGEAGFEGSIRLRVPTSPRVSAVVDAQYLYALNNSDTSGTTNFQMRTIQILGGIAVTF